MAFIIWIPVTGLFPFKGNDSRDNTDAPGWKHPLTGWLLGKFEGTLFNTKESILALTFEGFFGSSVVEDD